MLDKIKAAMRPGWMWDPEWSPEAGAMWRALGQHGGRATISVLGGLGLHVGYPQDDFGSEVAVTVDELREIGLQLLAIADALTATGHTHRVDVGAASAPPKQAGTMAGPDDLSAAVDRARASKGG